MMCPADHKHGETGTCYVIHKCRCDQCRETNRNRERTRRKLKAYGRYDSGLVDAEPVREHVRALQAAGLGYVRVARLAGVQPRSVGALLYGRQESKSSPRKGEPVRRMKRENAEKILAVEPSLENLGAKTSVPSRGTRRRLQALVAIGWSMSKLAAALDMNPTNFGRVIHSKRPVHAETARRVIALYEEWSHVAPPNTEWRDKISVSRSKRYARERRWPVPMDWESIDNNFERQVPVRRSVA